MFMKLILLLIVLIVCVLKTSSGKEDNYEKCRTIPSVENYNPEKIKGFWYVYEVGDEAKSNKKCMIANITSERGVSENSIVLKEIGLTENKQEEIDVSMALVKGTSLYIAQASTYTPRALWVVGTDYKKYATWFLCKREHQQEGIIFITTRTKNPDQETVRKAHESLTKVGLKVSKGYLFVVDRSECNE